MIDRGSHWVRVMSNRVKLPRRSPVLDLLQILIHRLRDDLVAEIYGSLIVRRGYHVAESRVLLLGCDS